MMLTTPDNTRKVLTTVLVLVLSSLACMEQVVTPTPTVSAVAPTPSLVPATPTRRAVPSATAEDVQTNSAVVRVPIVRVRVEPGGASTEQYVYAGQQVTVLENVTTEDGGEWVRIADPAGWIWAGCLEGSEKGCVAE
jgi:hypothetical protein